MLARASMPAVRQKRSKLAPTSCQASSTIAAGTMAADVVNSFMALLSFVDPAPRAYWLKVSNACLFQHRPGHPPERHLARFVVAVIEGLDLRALSGSYRGSGSASY